MLRKDNIGSTLKTATLNNKEMKTGIKNLAKKRVDCLKRHSRRLSLKVNQKISRYNAFHMMEELDSFESGL
jgi:hypothetical protein